MGWEGAWGVWGKAMDNNYVRSGNQTTQKVLSQDAVNKLIYDVLSSDQGLASLASGENLSGGFKSSSKSLLAQDLVTKIIGELANITAPTTTTNEEVKSTKEGRAVDKIGDYGDKYGIDVKNGSPLTKNTVICTELNRQGLLEDSLYEHPAALAHFESLDPRVIRGYHSWGVGAAAHLASSPRLSRWIAPIARSRYQMITTGKFHFLGALTIYLAQPICFVIGSVLGEKNAVESA